MKPKGLCFVLALVIFIWIGFICSIQLKTASVPNILSLNGMNVDLMLADTKSTREQGLSNTDSLPTNSAMLFVFDQPDRYGIWMKDMNYPIDIIWLDENKRIAHIESNVSPQSFPKVFYPSVKSAYVLETNANFANKNGIKVGEILNF